MPRRWLLAIAVVAGLLLIGGPFFAITNDNSVPEERTPALDAASQASAEFLDGYVDPDGRVVRRDQGDDTVSEGQAYAMLIAVATGDRARFDSTWVWAKENLRQPNGLFAWKWANGSVQDAQPATDADMDMARALIVAADRFREGSYRGEARELSNAIADNELAFTADGRPAIVAGPWARTAPYYTNPSYHSPRAERALANLTKDPRWTAVIERERELMNSLIGPADDPKLPPDWAQLAMDGTISPASPPGGGAAPVYSYDAVRAPIRLAESCDPVDRDQAMRTWTLLNESRQTRTAGALSLDGDVVDRFPSATAAVASAAAAKAAGDTTQMNDMLDLSERANDENRSYYGSAWVALGRVMLSTEWLGRCSGSAG